MLFILHSMAFLTRVALLPMLADGLRHFRQPRTVFRQFRHFRRGEVFDAILRRVAERLEQPRRDENRYVVRLAVQNPADLFRREAGGQLS